MPTTEVPEWARECDCEIRFDALTRQLYATDGSIHQITPRAVAFPRSAEQAASAIRAASEAGVDIIPRGAGTGLAGGALGDGLVIDFARHNTRIDSFDEERRTIRVGAGVILDQLNAFVRPHGLCFGPDVATSDRATLGGMIANNSSGARVPVYGTTADHVCSIEMVMADGRRVTVGADLESGASERAAADRIVSEFADAIRDRLPAGLLKRWHGYALDRYLDRRGDLTQLLSGSEGTLAGIASAELRLVPIPNEIGLGIIFFASVPDAMQAAVEIADLKPAAIEHLDRVAFDQTRGQLAFRQARSLLRLDEAPCESMLLVEFLEDVDDKLAALEARNLGLRKLILTGKDEMEFAWGVRRAGLSLLTGRKGAAKPTAGIEDVAVRPDRLPDYVAGLRSILDPLGVEASFYGHAASGLLHVRPVVDLHRADGVALLRQIGDEVSALVRQFRGSIAGEHGVGIARTEFLADHLGAELIEASRRIKAVFDPKKRMNPGKIVDDGRYRFDRDLRQGAGRKITLPFAPTLAFAAKDESFVGHLEQCNGCGGCRKPEPAMCPTFIATGDEIMSTRGRANVIRAALERRFGAEVDPLTSPELDRALDYCLGCKACKTECPSNVDLALLKAELLHAKQQRYGIALADRLISEADRLGRIGCGVAAPANALMQNSTARALLERMTGLTRKRPLPPFADERFDRWFARRQRGDGANRGRVFLWDDTFVRYHDPHIGRAAVRVLEAVGYAVTLVQERVCCGRPAFSVGRLDEAARLACHNVDLLSHTASAEPIVFLEPSCYSMFVDDYRELGIPGWEPVARRCHLIETFLLDKLDAIAFGPDFRRVAVHAHCHAQALMGATSAAGIFERLPNTSVRLLNTGCCGMAGAFGMQAEKYELSVQVAEPLVAQIGDLPEGTLLAASGTSCRRQINDLTSMRARHPAEILAGALECRDTCP